MNVLKEKYYITEILKTKLGNSRGITVKAKPIFILSIIDCIEAGSIKDNIIELSNQQLRDQYFLLFRSLEPGKNASPFVLPFYHLSNESFYHIQWIGEQFVPSSHSHSPSEKYIKENASFSYLDNALWDILKVRSSRDSIREQIRHFYF